MKRAIFLVMFILLLTSLASAEMIFKEQPKELYNLGEIIKIPLKVATSIGVEDTLSVKLICNGIENEIKKDTIILGPGEEQDVSTNIRLNSIFLGRTFGECVIKASLGEESILSNEFTISNLIIATIKEGQKEFSPGESVIIEGTAIKENQENVNGFIEVKITNDEEVKVSDTVKNGYFFLSVPVEKDTPTGQYVAIANIYEKDGSGNISNQGIATYNFVVKQIPTNLEMIFENTNPGETLQITTILHDQSGEKIDSNSIITLRNEKGKILEQVEIETEEYLEYEIPYNQVPSQWSIFAKSDNLTAEESFNISENEVAEIEIINRTVIITNKGNVPYNETVLITIGNETIDLDTYLEVDESKKYTLSAPEGEYEIEIMARDDKITKTVMLTGNAIKINEISMGTYITRFPLVWIFIVAILGFTFLIVLKKGYRQTFIGYIKKYKKPRKAEEVLTYESPKPVSVIVESKNPAILSLSIKGEEQDASIICLKIKNNKDLEKNTLVKETLQKITELAESNKAVTYQNQNNLIFMWVPIITKTFKNQKRSIEIAEEIKEILNKYNNIAKEKIDYGISADYGTIIAKKEKEGILFMSMGTFITESRKLATLSTGEIYLNQKMYDKTMADVKVKKHEKDGQTIHSLSEIKTRSNEQKKFIHNFIEKLEKENKEAREKSGKHL